MSDYGHSLQNVTDSGLTLIQELNLRSHSQDASEVCENFYSDIRFTYGTVLSHPLSIPRCSYLHLCCLSSLKMLATTIRGSHPVRGFFVPSGNSSSHLSCREVTGIFTLLLSKSFLVCWFQTMLIQTPANMADH